MDNAQVSLQKLESAARNIDKSIALDCSAPSLANLMQIKPPVVQTASGLTDQDYPVLSGAPQVLTTLSQIKTVAKVPLPAEIVEHFGHVQCHCMMGLFPEIQRAWLTIDSDIYIWTYEDGSDLAYYDGLHETILSAGLVKPKPGVFHAFIKYLLVLTTTVDVVVLGVTFTAGQNGPLDEIQLIPEPVFSILTDGAVFSTVAGTAEGRLFLGSKEGSLYEISYQAESGWFGQRCKKINHSSSSLSFLVPSFLNAAFSEEDGIVQISIDDSRHILYVLTEKSSIGVYDLGAKADGMTRVTHVAQSTLVNRAVEIVKTLESQNFRPIVSITAIEEHESAHLNLVAVTQTGVRFYLTTQALTAGGAPKYRPYCLNLTHVRLPPGYSASVTIRPRAVHMAAYGDRNLLLLSTVNEKDVLWCISSDLFPFTPNLMEAHTTVTLDSPALALAEVPHRGPLDDLGTRDDGPLVVRQHSEPPKRYVVLTSHAVYIFAKLRPVDILRQLLSDSRGLETDLMRSFFLVQKEEQACAACLIVASLDADEDVDLAEYACRAFFVFGGEPRVGGGVGRINQTMGGSVFLPNVVSTPGPNPNLFHEQPHQRLGHNVTFAPSTTFDSGNMGGGLFTHSAKHNGLYLYLGRILRPLWNRRCVDKILLEDGKTVVNASTVTGDHCRWILKYLTALHNFLLNNTQLDSGDISATNQLAMSQLNNTTAMAMANVTTTGRLHQTTTPVQDAQLEERFSLNALKVFVAHCRQVIGLWRILCEHQFHVMIGSLPETQQQVLQSTTFNDLFLYGQDVCCLLINTLVESYLADNASVDSISQKLREVCPQLYRIEDAAFSKANEMLKTSRVIQNIDEKDELVASALQLCKSIAPNVNLPAICRQFVTLKAYDAVIDLCLCCAKKIDPDNLAQHFFKSDGSASGTDQECQNFYQRRMDIYKEVFNMLDSLCNENPMLNLTQGLNITGQVDCNSHLQQIEGDARFLVSQIINQVLENTDEVLHVALYDWMLSKNMTSELIKVNKKSLENYLIYNTQRNPENVHVAELLWKYYENDNNHAAAAKILDSLASKSGTQVPLHTRLEYLTRAIMCMRSDKVGYAPYLGVFLRDLEDKMDVARVQENILAAVTALRASSQSVRGDTATMADEAITALNSGLYQISELFENFAQPLELWECQLAILDCAGINNEILVKKLWRNILKKEIRQGSGSPNSRMAQILAKVKTIHRERGTNTNCFPLEFLLSELEQLATFIKADPSLVPRSLVTMEVNVHHLIALYGDMALTSNSVQIWQKEGNEFHMFEAVAALIEAFIGQHESYTSVVKRQIISQCQDTVASLLSVLYSKPNTDDLINRLRDIQSRLSRL